MVKAKRKSLGKMKTTAILAYLIVTGFLASASTWYAAADGSSTNGTQTLPWGVLYSVTNSNPHLQPGDTVLFKSGTFDCLESDALTYGYDKLLVFRKAGTASSKITYRPETLWGFTFNGGLVLPNAASNLIIRDFKISYSGFTNRAITNYAGYALGINAFSVGSSIMHNLIENCGHPGIGSWSGTSGKYIAGNIIRFVGFDDWDLRDGSPAGSGMYLQQSASNPEALIKGNISYFNYTTGMKAYGNQNINGFNFTENIVAETHEGGIFYHQDQVDSEGFQMRSNYVWNGDSGLRIGYQLGNANPSNAVIIGNYVVDTNIAISIVDDWKFVTLTNNIFANPYRRHIFSLGVTADSGSNIATHTMFGNRYYAGDYTGFGTNSFQIMEAQKTLLEWKSETTEDFDAVLTVGNPGTTDVRIFNPSTDANFVHVAVFNWPTNFTTTVNLSAYFPSGAILDIYDAQDIPNAYTNAIFGGSTVTLDLTRTNRATMLGTFSSAGAWGGFDPRFRAFVVHRRYPAYSTANSATVGRISVR